MSKTPLFIAFTVALLATLGSLFLSEVLHWVPCVLCWYQRTMLYPLVIIFAVAILKNVTNLKYIVWPMIIIGSGIAIYHNLLQYGTIPEALAPCTNGTSCITEYHILYQFITVPLLSLITFLLIAGCMLVYQRSSNE